jgi:MoaA/NifB/PqqE/SkfB family radical SAM enzyme
MRTFSPRLAAKAMWQLRARKRPYVLSHGITARCNLQCRFCEYWKNAGIEMSTPEIIRMLDDAHSFGIGVYNAWTAEPLLRSDLPEILHYAKGLGMMTSLITNGKLLSNRIHELEDLDYLSVSVDGIDSYRELRGFNIQDVLEGIKAARSAGHEILMNCVISGKNLDEIEDLVNLAKDLEVWISFEPINESEEIERKVWNELGIRDTAKYEEIIERLIELKKSGAPIINSGTYLKMIKSLKPDFNCHASDIIFHVAADGTIENCRSLKTPLGKVSDGIANVWKESKKRRRSLVDSCRGCLFFGYVENSLLYELVPEVMTHYEWM